MKIRIRFSKYGVLKFIGHLDVMRYFQKAMRRAEIDICYSTGYSPHQIMSFASPLGVGLTSEGEYMDIEVSRSDSSVESLRRLNAVMAEGIDVLSYRQLPEGTPNAMASVAAADYRLSFREGTPVPADWPERLGSFLERPELLITKKTKKSERTVDLKPNVHAFAAEDCAVRLRLSAGSVENIKPELVMEAFLADLRIETSPYALLMHRLDLLAEDTDTAQEEVTTGAYDFRSLDSFGTDLQ